jgi:hypothetical protein
MWESQEKVSLYKEMAADWGRTKRAPWSAQQIRMNRKRIAYEGG